MSALDKGIRNQDNNDLFCIDFSDVQANRKDYITWFLYWFDSSNRRVFCVSLLILSFLFQFPCTPTHSIPICFLFFSFSYGFVASTSIKFILVLDRIIPRENDLIKVSKLLM